MSVELIANWLNSGRNAVINKLSLRPIEHKLRKGLPLSSVRVQAAVFYLIDNRGNWWILKKFHSGYSLDRKYLQQVNSLLPKESGFICGTSRQLLSKGILNKTSGFYYDKVLDQWLDGTILMPRISGMDWASLADDLRSSKIKLDKPKRFTICRKLTYLIEQLEKNKCCHRDLSSGNVFIDPDICEVYLIDFDSFFHPSIKMPKATTCGTTGYMAHFSWDNNDNLDPRRTWSLYADRYALSLLIAEFMLVTKGTKMTNDGGIFDQQELKNQSGKGLNSIIHKLEILHPQLAINIEKTISAARFDQCPSPHDWHNLYQSVPGLITEVPHVADFPEGHPERYINLLSKQATVKLGWSAPKLKEM